MKSYELQLLESLHRRYPLQGKMLYYYENLKKGYEGEKEFERLLNQYRPDHCKVYHDILIDVSGVAQIDFFVILEDRLLTFEIKNHLGHTTFENNQWTVNGKAIPNNYFIQVKRAEEKLQNMLARENIQVPFTSYLVFINEFNDVEILDEALVPVLKRCQLFHFFKNLQSNFINEKLTRQLGSVFKLYSGAPHMNHRILTEIPTDIRPGIYCESCLNFTVQATHHHIVCTSCQHRELKSSAAIRLAKEYAILFPDKRIFAATIGRFSLGLLSDQTILKILKNPLEL